MRIVKSDIAEELVENLKSVVEMNQAVIQLLTLRIELLEEEVIRLQREKDEKEEQ